MGLASELFAVFGARADSYTVGRPKPTDPSKYAYFRLDEPYTLDVFTEHLRGNVQIAVYPIHENRVRWAAFDFDAPKAMRGSADAFDAAWTEALMQREVLEAHGLPSYLERSRSGTGVHLWMFFDDWVPAELVRKAILPLIRQSLTYDRIYPLQSELGPGEYGNALALPYNGQAYKQQNSVFLTPDTRAVVTPQEFLQTLQYTSLEVLETLAAKAPPLPAQRKRELPVLVEGETPIEATLDGRPEYPLVGWLKVQSTYGCGIMRWAWEHRHELSEPMWYAVLQQASCFEQGRELAHILSRDDPRYTPREVDDKYNHALENPPMGCAALHAAFPNVTCAGCVRTAPYHLAKRTLRETVFTNEGTVERGGFQAYRAQLERFATGRAETGLRLGHDDLDRVYRMRGSELTVVGALPNMGKTALMIDASLRTARQGITTFVFSNETGPVGLRNRYIAHAAGINSMLLRGEFIDDLTGFRQVLTAEEWARVDAALAELDQLPLYLDFVSMQPDQMLRSMERVLIRDGIGFAAPFVAFHDYLQFVGPQDGETLEQRTSRVSEELKAITKITRQPLLTFSQLVRGAEGVQQPQMNWFRGSGRIEHDSDAAFILTGNRDAGNVVRRSLWLLKQREGDVGIRFDFDFEKPTSRWTSALRNAQAVEPCLLD